MRFNLSHSFSELPPISAELVNAFGVEYDITDEYAYAYISSSIQGLDVFVDFVASLGFKVEKYFLPIPVDFLSTLYREDEDISDLIATRIREHRLSISHGIMIPDDDPKLVEYKLKLCE